MGQSMDGPRGCAVHERLARRVTRSAAAAIGAALALLPSSIGRDDEPGPGRPAPESSARIDPLTALVRARMPSSSAELAVTIASVVRAGAQGTELDPLLVLAVIEVESDWKAAAVSDHGARGLMQLRKAALAEAERAAGVLPGDAHDPVHNVRMGIRYLARMVERFGDVDRGLMAYNAGPSRLLSYHAAGEVPDSVRSYARKVRREERKLRDEQSNEWEGERSVVARCEASHRPPLSGIALDTSPSARLPAVRSCPAVSSSSPPGSRRSTCARRVSGEGTRTSSPRAHRRARCSAGEARPSGRAGR